MKVLKILFIILLLISAAVFSFILFLFIDALICLVLRSPRRIYKRRTAEADFCPLDRIPDRFINMILLSEDDVFRQHKGISKDAIRNAIRINRKYRRIIIGGSTITQQLVKNLYLHFGKSILRKMIEMIIAVAMEWSLSKDEILELYVNVIYYGCGCYGLSAASEYYFTKKPEDLTVNQMFMLVRILNAPTANNPLRNPDNYIISRDRRIRDWRKPYRNGLTAEEAEVIGSYSVDEIDPELRKATDERTRFATVPLRNERFGPHAG